MIVKDTRRSDTCRVALTVAASSFTTKLRRVIPENFLFSSASFGQRGDATSLHSSRAGPPRRPSSVVSPFLAFFSLELVLVTTCQNKRSSGVIAMLANTPCAQFPGYYGRTKIGE